MLRHLTPGLVLLAALTACGGGGSTGSSVPPVSPVPTPGLQSIKMSIRIPAATTNGAASNRRPLYISQNTQSASIAVNNGTPVIADLSPNSPNCVGNGSGRTCTISVSAPVGTDTFAESLYASTNATGPVLSKSTTSAKIVAGTQNVVNIVLDGVIATLGMSLSPASPPVGAPASIALTMNFNDASGATIIGSDPFANPVTLTDSDQSGITVLSKTALNSPADAANLTVTYNGKPLASAVFTGTAAGVASATATLTPQNVVPVTFNDYTTFGYDNQRDVYNPNTTAITPTSVSGLHLAWQKFIGFGNGDYNVQTQPILATEIPNHAGVLFVGGGSGYVAAHDALTGTPLWSVPTGQETYACDPAQPGNTSVLGVGGSVAYDPATRSVYVTGNSNSTTNGFAQNLLYRLDGASGATLDKIDFGAGQVGPGELNFTHTSVTLAANGIAYVGTAATCDVPSWRGRVAAINTKTAPMSLASTFFTVWDPNNLRGNGAQPWGGGGIWGWGGVSLDFNGNILTGVGNTDDGSSQNGTILPPFVAAPHEWSGYGESLIQLTGDLTSVLASNHPIPANVYGGQSTDLDVNGTPAIFKPALGNGCGTFAALQAKSGALVIYDTSNIANGPSAQFQLAPSAYADGFLGSPAFSPATNLLYAPVASSVSPNLFPPGMIAIDPCGSGSVIWHSTFGPDSTGTGVPRSVPAVSAGGVVFVATACDAKSGPCAANGSYGALWELDASTGKNLNGTSAVLYTNSTIRAPATIDGNWVYVIDQGGEFYGLTIDPHYAAIAAKRRSVNTRLFFNRQTTQHVRRRS